MKDNTVVKRSKNCSLSLNLFPVFLLTNSKCLLFFFWGGEGDIKGLVYADFVLHCHKQKEREITFCVCVSFDGNMQLAVFLAFFV